MKISRESFIDLIWPTIKEYTSSNDCARPFYQLKQYFDANGYVLSSESENLISFAFEEMSDIIRDIIFDVNTSPEVEKSYKQCCDFLQKAMQNVAKAYKISPFGHEKAEEELESRVNQWFKNYLEATEEEGKKEHLLEFKNASDYFEFLNSPEERMQKLKSGTRDEIVDEIFYANGEIGIDRGYGPIGQYVIDATIPFRRAYEDGLDQDQVQELMLFLSSLDEIKDKMDRAAKIRSELSQLNRAAKLSVYHENSDFINDCKKLISVLTPNDRYHGTNYSALESIMQNGLYMVQQDLDSTSLPLQRFHNFKDSSRFLDDLLLYRSGIDGARGEGIVLLKENAGVKPISSSEKVSVDYSMTGFLGVRYKVDSSDIIGVIDTINKKVGFGAEFEKRSQDKPKAF